MDNLCKRRSSFALPYWRLANGQYLVFENGEHREYGSDEFGRTFNTDFETASAGGGQSNALTTGGEAHQGIAGGGASLWPADVKIIDPSRN